MTTTAPLYAPKTGVQTLYTEQQVSAAIRAKKDAGMSLRAIASEYGLFVSHADIERALQGRFPHNQDKRAALKLAPICTSCGQHIKRDRHVPEWVKQATAILAKFEQTGSENERIYTRRGKRVLT
jgi:hypothetical protein